MNRSTFWLLNKRVKRISDCYQFIQVNKILFRKLNDFGTPNSDRKIITVRGFLGNDLDDLKSLFSSVGRVVDMKIYKDPFNSNKAPVCAIIYEFVESIQKAISKLHLTSFKDRYLIVSSYTDTIPLREFHEARRLRRVFVQNLDRALDENSLKKTMSLAGNVVNVEIFRDSSGKSQCCGICEYDSEEIASRAIQFLQGTEVNGRKLVIGPDKPVAKRQYNGYKQALIKYKTPIISERCVFISHLPTNIDKEEISRTLSVAGSIQRIKLFRDNSGSFNGKAIVEFSSVEGKETCIRSLNKTFIQGQVITIRQLNTN